MNTLSFSANAVLPILLTMLLGVLFRKMGWLNTDAANGINKLCFKFLIPINIFKELYSTNVQNSVDWKFICFGVAFILITLLLLCLLVPRFLTDSVDKGECIQGIFRGSVSLISVSLLTNLYGSDGVAAMSFLLPITLVLYNALSVVILAVFFNNGTKISVVSLIREAIKNPFVIASVLGTLFAISGLQMPTAFASVIKSVGATGTPMALIAMGALIDFKGLFKEAKVGLIASAIRQLLIPLIVLGLAVLFGFRGSQLGSYLCIVCTPTATVGYVLSINMGGSGKLASKMIVYTTILSFVSMFVSIAILHSYNLL